MDGDGWQFEFGNNYGRSVEDDIRNGISAPHQGIFIRRAIMARYPFDTRYRIAADFKLNLQLWTDRSLDIRKVRDKVAYYSVDGTSGRSVTLRREESLLILRELSMEASAVRLLDGSLIERFVKKAIPSAGLRGRIKRALGMTVKHSCGWAECPYCGRQGR